jgi:predicted nuclease with RNAse H fold
VPGTAALPAALAWFPAERRQKLRLAPQSVLGMHALKRGYAAQYGYGKAFVVVEATPQSAAAVMEQLRNALSQDGMDPVSLSQALAAIVAGMA